MYEVYVIEDNGGGLQLAALKDGQVVYAHDGYEYTNRAILDDIREAINNPDTSGWEGCMDDPQAWWDALDGYPHGWEVVYHYADGVSAINHDRMGAAAATVWGRAK